MSHLADQLAAREIFAKLTSSEQASLVRLARRRAFDKGEHICQQGDIWPYLLFVESGLVKWSMCSLSGQIHTLFLVEPEDVFWGHSIFDGEPMPASLIAAEKSVAYLWHHDDVFPIVLCNIEATQELLKHLVTIMRKAREIIYGLAFQPVTSRLARLLLERSVDAEGELVERDMTLEEMAALIGSSGHVICRLLYQLEGEGILEITRATITIRDKAALERIVES